MCETKLDFLPILKYNQNMTTKNIRSILKKYKSSRGEKRVYLRDFTKKMVYRTTKTENPETTMGMVEKVLKRLSVKTR